MKTYLKQAKVSEEDDFIKYLGTENDESTLNNYIDIECLRYF